MLNYRFSNPNKVKCSNCQAVFGVYILLSEGGEEHPFVVKKHRYTKYCEDCYQKKIGNKRCKRCDRYFFPNKTHYGKEDPKQIYCSFKCKKAVLQKKYITKKLLKIKRKKLSKRYRCLVCKKLLKIKFNSLGRPVFRRKYCDWRCNWKAQYLRERPNGLKKKYRPRKKKILKDTSLIIRNKESNGVE